jgi:fructose-bisphosphate aldolase class I
MMRIVTNPKFNCARIIAVIISMQFAATEIEGMSAAQYVWKLKGVIPFTILGESLDTMEAQADGVQLMTLPPDWEGMLDKAASCGIFGVQLRGLIKEPNKKGIAAVVGQQFDIGKKVMEKGLMPNLLLEVDINCTEKQRCEELLLTEVLSQLGNLTPDQKVTLTLTIPSKANLYLQLIEHPNVVRVGAPSAGYKCLDACRMLCENTGMIGVFGRAFTERLKMNQSDEEFTATIVDTCKVIHEATVAVSAKEEQTKKVSLQDGFAAILDNSGSALMKILKKYGIDTDKLDKTL